MNRLLSIDPGMETGIVVMGYERGERPRVLGRSQVLGGLAGLLQRIDPFIESADEITCESFSPRPGERSWKLDELEPLRIEGALQIMTNGEITWRRPEQRKLIGTLPRTEAFLKATGYWTTPKMVNRPDANDANSAMMHAIGYLRDRAHRPTIDMLIEYGETMTEELV